MVWSKFLGTAVAGTGKIFPRHAALMYLTVATKLIQPFGPLGVTSSVELYYRYLVGTRYMVAGVESCE